jgi:hypothetical protein
MKRTDLKVGQDYLYSSQTDWLSAGARTGRVRLVDKGNWISRGYYDRSTASETHEVETAAGKITLPSRIRASRVTGDVLVEDITDEGTSTGKYRTLRSAEIKAEWGYAIVEVNKAKKERAERAAAAKKVREEGEAVIAAFHEQFNTEQVNNWSDAHRTVRLSLDDAQRVMEQAGG